MKFKLGFCRPLSGVYGFYSLLMAAVITFLSAGPSSANDLLSIRFINNTVGFVSGRAGYLTKTTDAGQTWNIIHTQLQEDIHDISPLGEDVLIAACSNGKILKTIDGGLSWESKFDNSADEFKSIFFTYDAKLIVCGKNSGLYTSNDFGETWEKISIPVQANLNKISFISGLEGYITGSNSTLLITEDGGNSWTLKTLSALRYNFNSISMLDVKSGIISGDGGILYNTTDGWRHWKKYDLPSQLRDIYDIKYVNSITALAIGSDFILKTADNGRNWTYIDLPIPPISYHGIFSKICFTSHTNGFVIGTNNIKLATTNQGDSWRYLTDKPAMDRLDISSGTKAELKNYPNPFNPGTVISYSLPSDGIVKLKVYDIAGREITTLVDEYRASGSYTAPFMAPPELSSGIYYYTLSITSNGENTVKTQKMLLIK